MGKMFEIVSNDQRGGITAGEFNVSAKLRKIGFWSKPFNKFFLSPLLVAIFGGLPVYFLTNQNMGDSIFNVSSQNQQGGITAGQVNIGAPQRFLSDTTKAQLEKFRGKKISVSTIMGDSEALRLGQEIWEYLKEAGFDFVDFQQAVFSGPINGLSFKETNGEIMLIVGSNY